MEAITLQNYRTKNTKRNIQWSNSKIIRRRNIHAYTQT